MQLTIQDYTQLELQSRTGDSSRDVYLGQYWELVSASSGYQLRSAAFPFYYLCLVNGDLRVRTAISPTVWNFENMFQMLGNNMYWHANEKEASSPPVAFPVSPGAYLVMNYVVTDEALAPLSNETADQMFQIYVTAANYWNGVYPERIECHVYREGETITTPGVICRIEVVTTVMDEDYLGQTEAGTPRTIKLNHDPSRYLNLWNKGAVAFQKTVIHEMGHSLNLGHPFAISIMISNVVSVMEWFYPGYTGGDRGTHVNYVAIVPTNFDKVALLAIWQIQNG